MTAFYVMPKSRTSLRPGGLPVQPFAALDSQWDVGVEVKDLRRVGRYRNALRNMTRTFAVGGVA